MFTRDLKAPYSEGLPLPIPLAHNVTTEMHLAVGSTPTLNLPAEMVMVDPSDRLTWPWAIEFSSPTGDGSSTVTGPFATGV
jgi:hypothetical protein